MISIRWRLTFLLCLSMGVLFVVLGIGVFFAMKQFLYSRFDETLTAKARALITASEIDDGEFEIDLTIQDFAGFGTGGDDYFEIRRTSGELVLRSPSMRVEGRVIDKFDRYPIEKLNEPDIFNGHLSDGSSARFYLQTIHPKDDDAGRYSDLYLVVASNSEGLSKELNVLSLILVLAGGAAIFLMIPVIRIGLGRGLKPLDKLSEQIAIIGTDELDQRIAIDKLPLELITVASKLNEWLGQLQESFDRERRFSSHAAHELRTPITEIRSIAELGVEWPEEASPENCAEIILVCKEMEFLLERLSLLSRAEAGRQTVNIELLDLHKLVHTTIARYEEKATSRGLSLATKVEGEQIRTDVFLWTTIFQNLISNAVSHASEKTTVEIFVSSEMIMIKNSAPNLVRDDLPKLFERFWRSDGSRADYEHSGLGLSIVKVSSNLLGAECMASLSELGDLSIEVRFREKIPK